MDNFFLLTRVLGLNNLAPDIVEAIVNGAEPDGLSIAQIMKNIPEDWNEQGGFSVFLNGDSGNRLAAGAILPPFCVYARRVAAVAAKAG